MLEQERAHGDDSSERVQTTQPKRVSLAGPQRSHAIFDWYRSRRTGGCCHRTLLMSSSMRTEPFIMLSPEKGSQGSVKSVKTIGIIGGEGRSRRLNIIARSSPVTVSGCRTGAIRQSSSTASI